MTTVQFRTPVTVQLGAADTPQRSLSGLAVPYGVASQPSLDGERYQFTGPPANLADLLDVVRGHDDDAVIGRLAAPLDSQQDGLHAAARVFSTTAGSDVLVEATEGVLTGFSVSADITEFETGPDGVRGVTAWTARHLGVVRKPAFTEAAALRVAASAQTGGPTMTTTTTEPSTDVVPLPTVAELAAQVAVHLGQSQTKATHRLAEFATFGDYAAAVMTLGDADPDRARALQAAFAVADQITTDNPGVIPPGWRTDVKMVLDARRPAISGTGGPIGLPDSGMTSNWPYFDGNLDAIIAEQATQKTDLSGPKISILNASAPIHTAGAVSDISYQLLQRSSPSYLDAYTRILMAAWARYTESKFEHALEVGGTVATPLGASPTRGTFSSYLFGLSAAVEDATGSPASVVGVAKDVWLNLGGAGFPNPGYGIGSAGSSGTSDASTLRINVNGLEITRWPFLGNGKLVATNGSAARFAEAGPYVATAEDVRKLGRDVAVWGMYEEAEIYFAAGVQVGTVTALPPGDDAPAATSSKGSK